MQWTYNQMVKIKLKKLDVKKLTDWTKLNDRAKVRGPKCEFYNLWDQYVNS